MQIEQPPDLEIDALFLREFNHPVSANGKLERRIAWNLFRHLERNGWSLYKVYDTEETTKTKNAKEVMELLFNLDDAYVFVRKNGKSHYIYFTLGEGTDIICDYTFSEGDSDGFDALMNEFETDDYA